MNGPDRSKPGRKRAKAAPPDFDLWREVAATVTPLKGREGVSARSMRAATQPAGRDDVSPADQPVAPPKGSPQQTRPAPPRYRPGMTGLDRRTRQKLARGNVELDARIDLHGLGQENARLALLGFFVRCRKSGLRTVLVITGKGKAPYASHALHSYDYFDNPERDGILRRAFPGWLGEPEFQEQVSGFQPAHPRHGGGGAFYVRLRKPV